MANGGGNERNSLHCGTWLGLLAFVYCACLVITWAAEEIRTMPKRFGPLATHDWDAPDREKRQRLDSR
jgi:hypothetical protein